jgi:Leucine-rich repeat (LRR) protein
LLSLIIDSIEQGKSRQAGEVDGGPVKQQTDTLQASTALLYGEEMMVKEALTRGLLAAVLAGLLVHAQAGKAGAAPFTDKNLETAVREAIKETKKNALTDADLARLFVLDASGKGIKDLTGLEKCKNLAEVKLANNQIVDLKPLKDLTEIQSLTLTNNKITDLAPLAGLVKLQYLELSGNQVVKLDPLAKLTKLFALYLSDNKVSDLTPLGGLASLSSLALGKNQVKDIGPLAKVTRLSTLELKDNQVVDLTPLKKQTELRILMLERNKITDLTPLVDTVKADAKGERRFAPYLRLFIAGNPLSDAAKSAQVAALKEAGVRIEG